MRGKNGKNRGKGQNEKWRWKIPRGDKQWKNEKRKGKGGVRKGRKWEKEKGKGETGKQEGKKRKIKRKMRKEDFHDFFWFKVK